MTSDGHLKYETMMYIHGDNSVSNPMAACTTTSVLHCAKTSVSREADFAPDL